MTKLPARTGGRIVQDTIAKAQGREELRHANGGGGAAHGAVVLVFWFRMARARRSHSTTGRFSLMGVCRPAA